MTETNPPADVDAASDCVFETILDFLLPFFLASAAGDLSLARAAVLELIDAYNAATLKELDLVGQIISFSTVAMDSLRLSMIDPAMTDTKKLRYRSNAVALSRMAERCRVALDALQAKRPATTHAPRMVEVALPAEIVAVSDAGVPAQTVKPVQEGKVPPAEIEQRKQATREAIEAMLIKGTPTSILANPAAADPFAKAKAAAHAALAAAGMQRLPEIATGTRC